MNRTQKKTVNKVNKIERRSLVFLLLASCAVMLFFVGVQARTSQVQYEINNLNKQIQETDREIQNLEVQIKSSSNITNIEQKAKEIGMIYPDNDSIIYLKNSNHIEEFALALMESVYK